LKKREEPLALEKDSAMFAADGLYHKMVREYSQDQIKEIERANSLLNNDFNQR
jgi:hypothetical protein